jgi:hypothetical protein
MAGWHSGSSHGFSQRPPAVHQHGRRLPPSPGGNRDPHRFPGSKRAEVRSAFDQEQEQEFRDGPLSRDRGVDPALIRAGRRHARLAGHRGADEPGQRPVLARPARPARIPAAVDARDRPQHRTQFWDHLAAATATDSPEAGRQSGTAWLLLGHLSAGAGMIEQQPHEAMDRPEGFELRHTGGRNRGGRLV